MKFNERLLELRKKNGWSQEELGYKLDVSRQTISKWESGQTTPELEKLRTLSKIFDISVDELISDDSEEKSETKQTPTNDNVTKRKKSIFFKVLIYLLIVLILLYVVVVAYRYSIIKKINDCFWGIQSKVIDNGYYMEKRTFGESLNIGNPMTKEEHYYYNNYWIENVAEEDAFGRVKIKIYDGDLQNGTDLINSNRTIYIDMINHFGHSDEKKSKTIEFDEVNKTYRRIDNYEYTSYYNLIMSEYENMFNTLDYNKDWTNYFRYAMNLRIDINETKDGYYYMSNEKTNAPLQKDNAYIIINENKIIFEKIIYDKDMKSNYTGTRYKLRLGTNEKDVELPNMEEYIEITE